MKKGDRLVCKLCKNFTNGKSYIINRFVDDIFICIYDDKSLVTYFSLYDKNSNYVWDYFYSDKELRKIKLEQLNEKH